MTTHKKSIVRATIDRFDGLMAINESRGQAKETAREVGEYRWAFTTGRIHSFKTRSTYQERTLAFVAWARANHGIKTLDQLDARADELATAWLEQRLAEKKSPYTLQLERSALRMFFSNRQIGASVAIPRRERSQITRSRRPTVGDTHIQIANWQPLLAFVRATGLRRREAEKLRRCHISEQQDGTLIVHVLYGKGGKLREVPVLPGHESDVLAVAADHAPADLVFGRIPRRIDVHSYRREYAQALYLHYAPGRALPPTSGRLRRRDYDYEAAQRVSWALGHNRVEVVTNHYLR